MNMTRREFISRASLTLAAGSLVSARSIANPSIVQSNYSQLEDWSAVRDQFDLSREYIHLAPFYISSHPRPVREAIEKYRHLIDANPV